MRYLLAGVITMQMRFKFDRREGPGAARRRMGKEPIIHEGVVIEIFIPDWQLERQSTEELQDGVANVAQRAIIVGKTEIMNKKEMRNDDHQS